MNGADRVFVDSNVLLYSLSATDPDKNAAADRWLRALWQTNAGRISWQVLHEVYANALRKLRTPHPKARDTVEAYTLWHPVDTSLGLIQQAWNWTDRASLSYWDALILAAAERTGAAYLLSEDFQEDRRFGDILVLNPFRTQPQDYGLPADDKT